MLKRKLETLLGKVRGRMRRRTFMLLVGFSYAVLFAPLLVSIVAPGLFLDQLTPAVTALLAFLNLAALGLVYVGTAFIAVKRLQDIDKAGKRAVMTLLPGGFLLLLWIATQPPVDTYNGGNRYGRNPRARGRSVRRGEQPGERIEQKAQASTREPGRGAEGSDEAHVGRAL